MKTVDLTQFNFTKATIVPDTQGLIAKSDNATAKHPYIIAYEQEVKSYDESHVVGGKVWVTGKDGSRYKMKIEDLSSFTLRVMLSFETLDEAKEEILPENIAFLEKTSKIVSDSSYEPFFTGQQPKLKKVNGELTVDLDEKTGKEFFTQTRLVSKLDQYGNPIYGKDRNAQTAQAQVVTAPKETMVPIES